MKLHHSALTGLLAALTLAASAVPLAAGPVKVFILAGQSNMEGKAKNKLLEHQATDPKTRDLFTAYRKDDEWITRDDVFVRFLDRKGGLTIGYGSPDKTGMELAFGTLMGEHFNEPVLLIKTAWGGHSLARNFRPPSAKLPPAPALEEELEKKREGVKKNNEKHNRDNPLPTMDEIKEAYGKSYRDMMGQVKETIENVGTMFPELKGGTPEIAGFVWFQGWNDQYNDFEKEYASNMEHFIRDLRKDLGEPEMPLVIAVMGQNGSKPAQGAMLAIQEAQLSMEKLPAFKGNVKAVRTDLLIDKAAEELYPTWKDNFEQWEKTGSDRGYHYLGSAIWFNRIGDATAKAMLGLMAG